VQHVGPDRVLAEAEDHVVVELPVTNRAAFRSFVLSFLGHAEVLEPPELRAEIVAWLEQVS
jgi:predicted DNA-binding transcriptional regulator YafY